jgi:class 3 adenylate cyclase
MAADGSAAAIPAKLEEAASTLKAQQEKLLEARQQRAGRSLSNSRMQMSRRVLRISCDAVPVVYKQWHPAVSVLFADISSYTAMSQQVEPEQVGVPEGWQTKG